MSAVGPSMAFENLLEALREQYEQDVACARRQGSLNAGQEPAPVTLTNGMKAASGPQTQELEAAIPGMPDPCQHSIQPGDSRVGMTQVVPLDAAPKPKLAGEKLDRPEAIGPASALESQDQRPALERFVSSVLYDKISAALVVSNALFIAIQVEFMFPDNKTQSSQDVIDAVDYIYCVAFILELGIRLLGLGCRNFWCDPANKWWNIFDFVVVALSTMDTGVTIALEGQGTALSSISVLRGLRIVRIVRVLRIIRVLRFFQDLRIMIASVISTLKTATFAFALIFMIMFMFAVGITQLVATYVQEQKDAKLEYQAGRLEDPPDEPTEDMLFFFGSVSKTIFCLFMTIAGGIDWKDAVVPLMTVGPLSFFLYMSFVVLMILCVMNVLTGIFCQSAIDTAQKDKENVMRMQLQEKNEYIKTLKELFNTWDDSKDGKCSKKEFFNHINDHETEMLLRTLEIDARDALTLFELLDANRSGAIDLDEFITGCITLRGGAKAVHMEKVSTTSTAIVDSMEAINQKLQLILRHHDQQNPVQ